MKKLILFRHGKSSWDSGVSDFERDLSQTGIERTHKSASELKKELEFSIDSWYSSPAKRAERTADIAKNYFTEGKKINFDQKLYTFSFFDLLKFIKDLDNQYQSAILFGHNEAFTEFTNRLGNQFINNLPTSGVAIFEFETNDWKGLERGKTFNIIKPKEL